MDARYGLLQELSRQALCLRSHSYAVVAAARTARPSWHLYFKQRDRPRHRIQSRIPAELSFVTRLQSVSDFCRRKRRNSPNHIVHSRTFEEDAERSGIEELATD